MSSKLTPKGMRDIPPEDMLIREEVIAKIRQIFQRYGYAPLETPAMEYLDTLRAKAGPEVDKQIFVIEGSEYGLRFDLTVPLARYVASSGTQKPFKRYAIDVVWRKEEPQHGRFREFYQADVDIVGSASMRCEAEILSIARDVCLAFGFNKPKIIINNRKILDAVSEKHEFGKAKEEVFRVLDKLDKIGSAEVKKLLEEILGTKKANALLEVIATKGNNKKKLSIAAQYSQDGAKELEEIMSLCTFDITLDLSLVRGLGYYTGPIFEVKLSEDMGSIAGGGRYDALIGVYGNTEPATGISVGIERLVTLMMERNPVKKKTLTCVLVACVKPEFYKNTIEVAGGLREANIEAETDLNNRNLRKQFDYANSLGIPYVIVIGEKEAKSGKLTLRNMKNGKEEQLSVKQIIERLKNGC